MIKLPVFRGYDEVQSFPGALPGVDLVVPTIGNVPELRRLLESLVIQAYPPLRVIVVDKSPNLRILELVASYGDALEILHLQTPPCGVSHAINLGLAHASAEIIGIPDDDCWYPPGFLRSIAQRFSADPGLSGVTVPQVDSDHRLSHGRWARRPGPVTPTNVWGRAVEPGIFYRRVVLDAVGPFDESLGVGSGLWEAGQETEFLIRVVKAGYRVEYDPSFSVFHPGPERGKAGTYTIDRWRSYGAAMGHVMRMHDFPAHVAVYRCTRPLLGAPVALVRGDVPLARRRLAIARGRLAGWWETPRRVPVQRGLTSTAPQAAVDLPSMDLVIPTIGRPESLAKLLESVVAQSYPSLRVIIVDMSEGDASARVVERFSDSLEIVCLRRSKRGASKAKNLGLESVNAELVSVTDDDCWYPDGLLALVGERFASERALAGLSVMQVDGECRPSNGRWARRPGQITRLNVWGRAVAAGMFFRASTLRTVGPFDESLGPGSGVWDAGEETDILIRILDAGLRVDYDPSLFVHHPDPERDNTAAYPPERWQGYARASGRIMGKHGYPLRAVAYRCARPLAGSAIAALRGDFPQSRVRLAVAAGRAQGWARSRRDDTMLKAR